MEIAAAKVSPLNPMTDAELEISIESAAYRGFKRDVSAIADAVWSLDSAADMVEMMSSVDVPGRFFWSRRSRLVFSKLTWSWRFAAQNQEPANRARISMIGGMAHNDI